MTNKTVSKWERGEGLPEISMLPVLAEVYEVTADEILAGRRLEKETEEPRQKNAMSGQWRYCFDRAYHQMENFYILAAVIASAGFVPIEIAKSFLIRIMNARMLPWVAAGMMLLFLLAGLTLLILGFRIFLQKLGAFPEEGEQRQLYSSYLKRAIGKTAVLAGVLAFFQAWNLSWRLIGAYPIMLDKLSMLSLGFPGYFGQGEDLADVPFGVNISLLPEEYFKILIQGFPISLIIGSLAGILVFLWLRKRYQSRLAETEKVRKQLRKQVTVFLLVLCVGIAASGGFKLYMNKVIATGSAEKMAESDFSHFVNQYFYTYTAFRGADKTRNEWPEYKAGDTEIAAEDFDYLMYIHPRYNLKKYVGVIRFDYENNTVYRRYIGEELVKKQRETRIGSTMILGLTCILAWAAWIVCRPKMSDAEV